MAQAQRGHRDRATARTLGPLQGATSRLWRGDIERRLSEVCPVLCQGYGPQDASGEVASAARSANFLVRSLAVLGSSPSRPTRRSPLAVTRERDNTRIASRPASNRAARYATSWCRKRSAQAYDQR